MVSAALYEALSKAPPALRTQSEEASRKTGKSSRWCGGIGARQRTKQLWSI